MKHILVGTDGSAGSAHALRWASRLALHHGAEVVAMTGFQPVDSELRPGRLESLLARRGEELGSWIDAARLDDVAIRAVVEHGDPRTGILAVAEREQADLIVIGRVGQSAGPGLFRIGSMAEWLAHHVDRPVAVIGHHPDPTIRNVLIGVDGSDGSRAAAAWVRDLAARSPGVLVVAASVEPPRPEWTADDYPADRRRDLERRIRDDFASELTGLDIDLEVAAVLGANAADALVAAARERQCDLVVVGARGLGGLTGLRVGGIALRTLHEADRSIVLIPPH